MSEDIERNEEDTELSEEELEMVSGGFGVRPVLSVDGNGEVISANPYISTDTEK